jgi:hypothetical protein
MISMRNILAAGVTAAILSSLVVACGGAPATSEGTEATDQAVTYPICDPPGRAPAGKHWSTDLCEWVPNCVDNVMCMTTSHWDPETCSCQANCVQKSMCMVGQHWNSSVCHCVY